MTGFRIPAGLEGIGAFHWRDAIGSHNAAAIRYRDGDNVLQEVFGIGAITVAASPIDVYGYGNSHASIVITTTSTGVTVSGGTPPYTYDWQPDIGAFEPIAPSSMVTAFRTTTGIGPGDGAADTAVCVVTDANGRTGTSNPVSLNAQNLGS